MAAIRACIRYFILAIPIRPVNLRIMKINNASSIVIAFILLLSSCDTWTENRAAMKQYAPENADISPDLVRANIATTDYSALVHVTRGKVKENTPLRRLGGYVNHIYQARVIETFRGPRYEIITFSVMADSDIDPILPEYPVIASLCGTGTDKFYIPDNGYELPATPALTAAARDFARTLKTSAPQKSVCSE